MKITKIMVAAKACTATLLLLALLLCLGGCVKYELTYQEPDDELVDTPEDSTISGYGENMGANGPTYGTN